MYFLLILIDGTACDEVRGAKDALWYGIVMEAPVQSEWMEKSKKKNCAKLVSGAIVQWLDYPSKKTNHNTFILTKTRAFIPFQAILRWGTGIGTLNLGSGKFDNLFVKNKISRRNLV